MKKIYVIIISILLPVLTWGQAQIETKKAKLGDFTQKITKVVLSGNEFFDMALQNEVTLGWRISPYEFCTMQEFETYKTSDDFYFLIVVNAQFKKDRTPTIKYLTLVKGGEGAEKGLSSMLEVVSIPVASAQYPSGREIVFLPALLDIMQKYTLTSMEKDFTAYGGLSTIIRKIEKEDDFLVVMSENDVCPSSYEIENFEFHDDEIMITDEEKTDSYMMNRVEDVLVGYVVAPTDPVPGAVYYKMLINAHNYQLYYFKKDKVSKSEAPGFTPDDIKKIHKAISKD